MCTLLSHPPHRCCSYVQQTNTDDPHPQFIATNHDKPTNAQYMATPNPQQRSKERVYETGMHYRTCIFERTCIFNAFPMMHSRECIPHHAFPGMNFQASKHIYTCPPPQTHLLLIPEGLPLIKMVL